MTKLSNLAPELKLIKPEPVHTWRAENRKLAGDLLLGLVFLPTDQYEEFDSWGEYLTNLFLDLLNFDLSWLVGLTAHQGKMALENLQKAREMLFYVDVVEGKEYQIQKQVALLSSVLACYEVDELDGVFGMRDGIADRAYVEARKLRLSLELGEREGHNEVMLNFLKLNKNWGYLEFYREKQNAIRKVLD